MRNTKISVELGTRTQASGSLILKNSRTGVVGLAPGSFVTGNVPTPDHLFFSI